MSNLHNIKTDDAIANSDSTYKNIVLIRGKKTRIEALNDRINMADNFLNSVFGSKPKVKAEKSYEDPEEKENQLKEDQINSELQKKAEKLQEQLDKEGVKNPFISRMTSLLSELKTLQAKTDIPDDQLDNEVNSLKKTGYMEISLSKIRLIKRNEENDKVFNEKLAYISKLEKEVVNQRIALEKLKKSEGQQLLKISTLEDQIRIFKSKVFGYDVPKKYEYINERQDPQGPIMQMEGDNLSNYGGMNGYTGGMRGDVNSRLMSSKQGPSANTNRNGRSTSNFDNGLINSYKFTNDGGILPADDFYRNRNTNKNRGNFNMGSNYGYGGGFRYENNKNEAEETGISSHLRKITPMILNNNH